MLRFVSLAILLLTAAATPARAAIMVHITDATITAGGSRFIDVLISSSTPVNLDFAAYDFEISLVGGPVSTLQFANPQDLTETGLGNYVFASDAAAINVVTLNNSRFVADAATLSFNGVGLTTTTRLLARLELESVLGPGHAPALVHGEQFRISLLNSGDTRFEDENGVELGIDPISFSSSGLITVQGTAAVPEPGSLGLFAIGAAVIGWRTRRQRSKAQVQ